MRAAPSQQVAYFQLKRSGADDVHSWRQVGKYCIRHGFDAPQKYGLEVLPDVYGRRFLYVATCGQYLRAAEGQQQTTSSAHSAMASAKGIGGWVVFVNDQLDGLQHAGRM
jgi:hypothetical protein